MPPLVPKSLKFCITKLVFCLKHTVAVTTDATNVFLYHLGRPTWLLAKTTLKPKLAGGWAREASQKLWDPLLISANVKAGNLKFWYASWVWRVAYQETTFRTKIGGSRG